MYLGCCINGIYSIQKTKFRQRYKDACKNFRKEYVNPKCLIRTEEVQSIKKILFMVDNFDIALFYDSPIQVINWGCALLIMNGHHRVRVAQKLKLKRIKISLAEF